MENLGTGIAVLFVGIGVVFAVLVILMLVSSLFNVIFGKSSAKKATENKASANVAASTTPQPQKAEFKPGFDTEDGELAAVIASSIAAYLNTGSGDIKIRSIRKVD